MQRNHYLILIGMLSAIGLQLAGLDSWSEALKPAFLSGVCIAAASTLGALFSDKIEKQADSVPVPRPQA